MFVRKLNLRHNLMLSIVVVALGTTAAFAQSVVLAPVRVTDTPIDTYVAKRSTTATKTDTPLIDIPQSISVVTKKEMADRAVSGMQDAVRYVPGVQFAQGEGNRDAAVLRGVATTSDFFLDGVRDDVEYFREIYNIERVEVLKGPNAMIFGRGATGGLINRVTRQANFSDGLEARLEGGSFGLFRGTIDANHAVSDSVALRLTGLYHRADSYRDGVNYERYGSRLPHKSASAMSTSSIAALPTAVSRRSGAFRFKPTGQLSSAIPPRARFGRQSTTSRWTSATSSRMT
jgi:catecholate siderophore receptor